MKTKDLLELKEDELSPELKQMKIKELEKHAKNITASLGEKNYEPLLAELIKVIPTLPQTSSKSRTEKISNHNNLAIVKNHLKKSINLSNEKSINNENKLTVLTVILMLIVARKFNKILKET